MILPDLLNYDLDIVFCGTAAGNKSAERKAYYAGKGNLFYPILFKIGLTPRQLKPEEYPELLNYNIGLTDLAKQTHGLDNDLKKQDFDIQNFIDKILKYNPLVVCFNGKEASKVYFGKKKTSEVQIGLQEKTIGQTKIFVAPSTSLQARGYWDENVWHQLQKLINDITVNK
jgi:double-stranded uracil-DNA glycosylase